MTLHFDRHFILDKLVKIFLFYHFVKNVEIIDSLRI